MADTKHSVKFVTLSYHAGLGSAVPINSLKGGTKSSHSTAIGAGSDHGCALGRRAVVRGRHCSATVRRGNCRYSSTANAFGINRVGFARVRHHRRSALGPFAFCASISLCAGASSPQTPAEEVLWSVFNEPLMLNSPKPILG